MMRYQPVTPEIVHELNHNVGEKHLIYGDEVVIALHRRIKAAFDPNHVLNPGKIFEPTARSLSNSHQQGEPQRFPPLWGD